MRDVSVIPEPVFFGLLLAGPQYRGLDAVAHEMPQP
jgi:hypothetical protein